MNPLVDLAGQGVQLEAEALASRAQFAQAGLEFRFVGRILALGDELIRKGRNLPFNLRELDFYFEGTFAVAVVDDKILFEESRAHLREWLTASTESVETVGGAKIDETGLASVFVLSGG
jgi:hypothetical protein